MSFQGAPGRADDTETVASLTSRVGVLFVRRQRLEKLDRGDGTGVAMKRARWR